MAAVGLCCWNVCLCLQLEVFPDEEIRLVNANQVPDDDYASVFDGVAGVWGGFLVITRQQNPQLCPGRATHNVPITTQP